MYDIIPGGDERAERPARPIRPKVGNKSQRRGVVYAGPRTVQLEWKLPSRLRKPIRDQLAKQRAQKRRRNAAAVSFARRSIRTQPLLVADRDSQVPGARVQKPRRFFNRGAEHHTGDMYKQGKPELHVAAPPYIGRIARRYSGSKTKPVQPKAAGSRAVARPVSSVPVSRRGHQGTVVPIASERDVPMQWSESSATTTPSDEGLFSPIRRPKRVIPGVTVSLWPGNWFGRKEKVAATGKKKRLIS